MIMKVCSVCQYEEEQDSEVSCAICGSDLVSSESTQAPVETEQVSEQVSESSASPETESEKSKGETIEESSMTDEEKLLEETLAATEIADSDAPGESSAAMSAFASFKGQLSKFGSNF